MPAALNLHNVGTSCHHILFLVVLLWPMSASAAGPSATLAVDALEQRILAGRRAIKSGKFELIRQYRQNDRGDGVQDRIVVWMDLDTQRVRNDHYRGDERSFRAYSSRWYTALSVKEGQFELADKRRRPSVTMVPLSRVDRPGEPRNVWNPIPFMLCTAVSEVSYDFNLEALVNNPARGSIQAHSKEGNGAGVTTVTFTLPINAKAINCNYDVAPHMGYSIVRMQLTQPGVQGPEWEETVECVPVEVAKGIWFPASMHTRQVLQGRITKDERLTIAVSNVNEQFDESVFEVAGLGVPVGTAVSRQGELLIWDGRGLRAFTNRDMAERMVVTEPAAEMSWRRTLLWASVVCVLAALIGWSIYARSTRVRTS